MKQLFALLVLATLLCPFSLNAQVWDGSVATGFDGGSGTQADPFRISNGAQLAYLADRVNTVDYYGNGNYFELTNDIVLNNEVLSVNDTLNSGSYTTWTPIGIDNWSRYFRGVFNGNGHSVKGLYIKSTTSFNGLFGYVYDATIKNLTVEDSYIEGGNYIAGIVAVAKNSTLKGLVNRSKVVGTSDYNGGVVGYNEGGAPIDSCFNYGNIIGRYKVGGIAGYNGGNTPITNCINAGDVESKENPSVGGIAGRNGSSVLNCANKGRVTGSNTDNEGDSFVGGLVGIQFNTASIENCSNEGAVSGNAGIDRFSSVGGIVGFREGGVLTILHTSNTSTISNDGGCCQTGGILGRAYYYEYEIIRNCSNSGMLIQTSTGNRNDHATGGIVGSGRSAELSNCINDGSITGKGYSAGIVGDNLRNCTIQSCVNKKDIVGVNRTGGIVGNLDVSNSRIDSCYNYGNITTQNSAGGIVAAIGNTSPISRCTNYGNINAKFGVGGIVGGNDYNSPLSDCTNYGNITSTDNPVVGGIAGYYGSSITNCKNLGRISGSNNDNEANNAVGGIVAYQSNTATISDCVNEGPLNYSNTSSTSSSCEISAGGIVGYRANGVLTLQNNSNIGDVSCYSGICYVGGIIAKDYRWDQSYVSIKNCLNKGNITYTSSSSNTCIGGLVGVGHSKISNSINSGILNGKGSSTVGVLVGYNYGNNPITNCYGLKTTQFNTNYPLVAYKECTTDTITAFDKEQRLSVLTSYNNQTYSNLSDILNAWVSKNGTSYTSWTNCYNKNILATLPELGAFVCSTPTIEVHETTLTLSSSRTTSLLFYTLDGSKPIESHTTQKYEGSVELNQHCIIRAVATDTGYTNSSIASFNYGLTACAVPVITFDSCTVTLSCSTPGATIGYTLDGNDPRDTCAIFSEPFNLFDVTTIKAYAYIDGGFESDTIVTEFKHPLLWDGTMATSFAGGSGTEANPYLIATAAQLKRLSYYTYYYENWTIGKFFKLIDDIVLNTGTLKSDSIGRVYQLNVWEPIGNGDGSGLYDFKGVFDGNGHTVHGVYHDLSTAYYLGLFGATNGAIVKNTKVADSYIHGYSFIGGIIGKCVSSALMNNSFTGIIKADNYYLGGLTSYCDRSTIDNCNVEGKINGLFYTAGISGYVTGTTISNCTSSATINNADEYAGGIAGYSTGSTIMGCTNNGSVYGADQYVGGISGYNISTPIQNCLNDGAISVGYDFDGGIVGLNNTGSPITNCINNGNITNYNTNNCGAGGITCVTKSSIYNCTNTGAILSTVDAAGIVAANYEYNYSFEITDCKNYGTVTARTNRAAGILANRNRYSIRILIKDSYNFAKISANGDDVGGIVGLSNENNDGGIIIEKCFNRGIIEGYNHVGGLVGHSSYGDYYSSYLIINNSYNESVVSGINFVGGLVGRIGGHYFNTCSLTSSYNAGTVMSTGYNVGGLCGFISSIYIKNCYNSANITSTSRSGIGGLIGYSTNSSQLLNCYNIGKVSGSTEDGITNGALVGYNQIGCSVLYCHSLRNDSVNLNLELYGVNEGTTGYLRGFDNDQTFEIGIGFENNTYDNLLSMLNAWADKNNEVHWIRTSDNRGFPIIENFKCATPSITESDYYYSIVSTTNGAKIYYSTDGSDPLKYGTVYAQPFTASNEGLIKAVAVSMGYFDSELATYDCSLTGILLGDANNDKSIRPSDVVTTVNYILGNDPNPFLFRAADVNNNGEITTGDVVNIVRLILGNYSSVNAPSRQLVTAPTLPVALTLSAVEMVEGGDGLLALSMENSKAYSAIQFDVELPEGISVNDIRLEDERFTSSHAVVWNQIDDKRVRVVVYSAQNSPIKEQTGSLLTVSLTSDKSVLSGEYALAMSRIYLIDAQGNEDKIDDINGLLRIASTTGLDRVKGGMKIISGEVLTIICDSEMVVTIYTTDGRKVRVVRLTAGENQIADLPKGVYLVNKQKAVVK